MPPGKTKVLPAAKTAKATDAASPGASSAPSAATGLVDLEKMGAFYLGQTEAGPYLYEARHLLTHGVVIGMTGSGKTGLAIALLEEAAIDGIPSLVIDPKGDLANLALAFPELRDEDFLPWVDARGGDAQTVAASESAKWRKGLRDTLQGPERIARLKAGAEVRVLTPGSRKVAPVSVLGSLDAPGANDDDDAKAERAGGIAASILGLLGVDADPVRSREYVLLTQILTARFADGRATSLAELVSLIGRPPIKRVGVLDLEQFFPEKERFQFAAALNNLLASPTFGAWLEGEPLDVGSMLYAPSGKPRVTVLSIAHLSDQERMFFVTLLLQQLLAWMRRQPGTSSLRAMFYMDEIFGYFPPVANPPSKTPLLTLLKQARAFGLGITLATQNPVDLDYKGLSNAGTWFVGRLQTDRDKQRVVEGLVGAAGGASIDTGGLERLLSALESRQFLVHNVHDKTGPHLVKTRFALSYLRGPLTTDELKRIAGPVAKPKAVTLVSATSTGKGKTLGDLLGDGSSQASSAGVDGEWLPLPALPKEIVQVYVATEDQRVTPKILGLATVQLTDTKANVDVTTQVAVLAPLGDGPIPVSWAESTPYEGDPRSLATEGSPGMTSRGLLDAATRAKSYTAWQKEFTAWILESQGVSRYRAPAVKLVSEADESEADFRARVALLDREGRDAKADKIRLKYAPKFDALRSKIEQESRALEEAKNAAFASNSAEVFQVGASMLGAIFGKGGTGAIARGVAKAAKGAGSAGKRSATAERREQAIADYQTKWRALDEAFQAEVATLAAASPDAVEIETISVRPKRTAVQVKLLALAWTPSDE
jgi:Helicase HerA, central domain